jgi:hypothetical protein
MIKIQLYLISKLIDNQWVTGQSKPDMPSKRNRTLHAIAYQQKKSKRIPPKTLIIKGAQDHCARGSPLGNQPLMIFS